MQSHKIQAATFSTIGIIIMTILILLSSYSKVEAQDKLNGKVKSMKESKFVTYEELKKRNSKTTVFDYKGNVLVQKNYNSSGFRPR